MGHIQKNNNIQWQFKRSVSSLFLGFRTFEPPMLGLLRKGDCLSPLCGEIAMLLMVPAAYRDGVAVQVCDLAANQIVSRTYRFVDAIFRHQSIILLFLKWQPFT